MIYLKNYHFFYSITGQRHYPIILFLHGFMGNCNAFQTVISQLSHRFCCVAVDLPGHGKTRAIGGEDAYRMPNVAKAIVDLLEELNIRRCFLVGYSMGGRLALYLTLHFPEKFAKVVLESASPGLKTATGRSRRRQRDAQRAHQLETTDFNSFLLQWYRQPIFHSLSAHRDFEKLRDRRLENNPVELAKSLRNMGTGTQPSLWEKLPENQTPLLLLVGESDNKFQVINEQIAQQCPAAQVKIIPESGHNIHWERPQIYAQTIRDFIG